MHWRNKIGEKSKEMMQMQLGCIGHKKFHTFTKNKSKRIRKDLSKDITNDEKMGEENGNTYGFKCADSFINFNRPVWSYWMNMLRIPRKIQRNL